LGARSSATISLSRAGVANVFPTITSIKRLHLDGNVPLDIAGTRCPVRSSNIRQSLTGRVSFRSAPVSFRFRHVFCRPRLTGGCGLPSLFRPIHGSTS
jgi:hypothetical protein